MTVGERIKQKRLDLNLSQDELAKRAGYSDKTAISKLEHAGNNITLKQIKRIAVALKADAYELMGWTYSEGIDDPSAYFDQQERMMLYAHYTDMIETLIYRQLLDAAEGCTPTQIQVAIDMLKTFKEK